MWKICLKMYEEIKIFTNIRFFCNSSRIYFKGDPMKKISRRKFIVQSAGAGVALSAVVSVKSPVVAAPEKYDMIVVKNGSPADMVQKAVESLGGMGRFVEKGQTVLLKPNIGWDRLPEQAANTNPEAVAQVVKMCLEAGARRVRVLDRTCNQARRCYKRSGIEKAVKDAGGEVRHIVKSRYQDVSIPDGKLVKKWAYYKDAFEADVLINMPIAKHHTISRVTLGFKNMMGLLGGERGNLHTDFMTKIVDINLPLKPALTIIDSYRVLMRNGPSGGNLDDVEEKKTIIAGIDRVAVDTYAATLFGIDPKEMEYLLIAQERGLGTMDLTKINMQEIEVTA